MRYFVYNTKTVYGHIVLLDMTSSSNDNRSKRRESDQKPKGEEDVPAEVQKVVSEEGG